jgi:hypothetical protein
MPASRKKAHLTSPKPAKPKTLTAAAPLIDKPLPARPPADTTVDPPPVPERPAPILVQTRYNTARLRKTGIGVAVVAIVGLGYLGWSQRHWLSRTLSKVKFGPSTPVYQLKVQPQTIDDQTAQLAIQQASLSASPSAAPDNGNSPTAPAFETDLASSSTGQLYQLLDQQIDLLQSEHQDVRTLQTYPTKARAAATNHDTDKERSLLMEGIQLSKEFQALYLYYKK